MRATWVSVVVAIAALTGTARADFIVNNTQLPGTKTNAIPVPPGVNPSTVFQASDYNALMQAINDLRTGVTTGRFIGLAAQASDPGARSIYPTSNYWWLDTNGVMHFNFGGTTNQVPMCAPTTNGDICYFNGTAWVRVGSNAPTPFALTDGATITIDLSQQTDLFSVTLGGNRTFALTNLVTGRRFMLEVIQDGTGSRTATWPAAIHWFGGSAPTLTTTAGQADMVGCVSFNGTTMVCAPNLNVAP